MGSKHRVREEANEVAGIRKGRSLNVWERLTTGV